MAIEALEGVTDQALFDEANADETPADEAVVEPAEGAVEQDEQPRDELGQFAAKPADEPAPPVATDPPAPAPVDDNAAMVPSWRVREINDEKRALSDRLTALEAERSKWQQPAPRVEPVPEVKAAKPDPLLDPEGYEKYLEAKFEARQLDNSREIDLRMTRQSNPELFDKAYAESQRLKQAGDPEFAELQHRVHQPGNPGKALLDWYQTREVRREVGNDPNAFFQKRLDAWLADPANQAKVIEKARGAAQQPQPGARPAVSLPPSLTRATNASADLSADDNDLSNDGLWRHANA